LAVLGLLAGLAVLPASATAATLNWSALMNIDGSNRLDSLDCPSATLCVAGEAFGHILSSTNPGADASSQECIAAALEKPTGVKVSVRHAGHNSGRHQLAVLVAQYRAMPEACVGKYYRGNHAKSQAFWNGKWARMNDYEPVYGGTYDNQAAFTGLYQGLAVVVAGDKPHLLNPCKVRILLKESVTRPEPHSDSGYHPTHNVAQRVYTFPVAISRIWPHKGGSCKLLVPHRYPQATRFP
jgi:hypothetical protein